MSELSGRHNAGNFCFFLSISVIFLAFFFDFVFTATPCGIMCWISLSKLDANESGKSAPFFSKAALNFSKVEFFLAMSMMNSAENIMVTKLFR